MAFVCFCATPVVRRCPDEQQHHFNIAAKWPLRVLVYPGVIYVSTTYHPMIPLGPKGLKQAALVVQLKWIAHSTFLPVQQELLQSQLIVVLACHWGVTVKTLQKTGNDGIINAT